MASFDILIRGGTVVDGTGADRRVADVAIADGRIAQIGDLGEAQAETVIDAGGLIVAPGFIDPHTHYDAQIFWDPYCTASGWHGVTTVHMSDCGFGLAPFRPELRERAMQMMTRTEQIAMETMREGVPFDWETHPEYLESLRRTPKGINVAAYFPLNPALFYAMGPEAVKERTPNEEEVATLQALLKEAMEAGALGLSMSSMGGYNNHTDFDGSQLPTEYFPEEAGLKLAETLNEVGRGIIQMLLKRPDSNADLRYMENMAKTSGRPVLYDSVVASFNMTDGGVAEQLAWLDECGKAGIPVYGQGGVARNWVEFTMEDFNLFDIVPIWAKAAVGTVAERVANFADPAIREEMKKPENFDNLENEWTMVGGGPHRSVVSRVEGYPHLEKYVGKSPLQIAEEEGRHPVDCFLDIVVETNATAEFRGDLPVGWDPKANGPIASHPRTFCGLSDGGAHSHLFNGAAWPTEVISWLVRDSGELTLEHAHYKLSGFPAEVVGYSDRGTLEVGKAADVIVYDYENLKATPELAYETVYDQPGGEWRKIQRAEGYRYTIVNGKITLIDGEPTGNLPGKVLSPGRTV